ncbi:uncharacterized protein BXZ73DRAFT_107741 [Epithele typhae]|uniref:uncharacterized protein n=1 Tax=Epithele typhae TaxID=378194 RepID=UPI002007C038|nr:uncharacterized protein BXZ73DRAFT_107741 [Epithele typhae]KAH9911912.1 hypothetical protein BXZ73DRAFT_107741 [Epithele typhae]
MVSLTCIPKPTKKIQRPRESMDLDNIMEGFDSEDDMGPYPMPKDGSHSAYEEALKSPRSLTRKAV